MEVVIFNGSIGPETTRMAIDIAYNGMSEGTILQGFTQNNKLTMLH